MRPSNLNFDLGSQEILRVCVRGHRENPTAEAHLSSWPSLGLIEDNLETEHSGEG